MRDVHTVRTPENVRFEHELAGLSERALGVLIDLAVMSTLVGMAALTCAVFGVVLAGFARAMYFVALFAIQWGYAVVLEWRWHGQTVGKRVLGTRVLTRDGLPIRFGQAALRNLLRVVDILPGGYLAGGLCALFDARARRFGDIAADTIVVRVQVSEWSRARRAGERGAELGARDATAPTSHVLTAAERDVLLDLLERREQLPLPVRHELCANLARQIEARLSIGRSEFLSDERFLLQLAAEIAPAPASKRSERTP